MIIKKYIKDFEELGFGMFVHYGLYSVLESGEWAKDANQISDEEYFSLPEQFEPKLEWATELVALAKRAGCKYITLTTRHHDGFSLFDTCGLSDFDAPHSKCGRDIVREFVDACRNESIIPFFYHTMFDWHEKSYETDFKEYLKYLRASVEVLCKNYGKIGGFWFDGMWKKKDEDWEEDALYGLIRKYQPDAMIVNNTGLGARGALGHIELDSVTFERGKPGAINMEGAPKYVASEMCEVFGDHWGYARDDFNYKSPARLIRELADCRRYRSNMLLNVGPMADGSIREMDRAMFGMIGEWVRLNGEAIRKPAPAGILVEGKPDDFILQDGKQFYLFCYNLPMFADQNVAIYKDMDYNSRFKLDAKIASVTWLDDNSDVFYQQNGEDVVVKTVPYRYGRNLVVRVAKIICE